jgi:hypothetical protein
VSVSNVTEIYCLLHGWIPAHVICPKCPPLPPTAEQTSIARFNALANEIRTNHEFIVGVMGSFENRIMEQHNLLIGIADQLRLLIDDERSRFATLTAHQDRLYSAVAKRAASGRGIREKVAKYLTIQQNDAAAGIKSRAVAKKKAAPLVGKKGTGRKG